MDAKRVCPVCGKPVIPDAPQGLCPECLIKSGFDTSAGSPPRPGQSEIPLPSVEQLARLFPKLEIVGLVGRGGMGAVYKARQVRLKRFVALKILLPEKQNDPQFAERFEREAGALASLTHPNIVTVHDFGEVEGNYYYLLMEFVEGQTLRQLLRERRLPAAEALAIIPQICQALQYAHEKGIVHRDIKPENILLDVRGQVKISDFGIAKLLDREPENISLTSAHHIMGTPHYMAPEQIEHPETVDHRADIYSLGVVFYEVLTGELPIGKFQPPSQKVRVDVRLDEVVLHALEKEPERRYQEVSQVKSDVETIAVTPPPAARSKAVNKTANGPRSRAWKKITAISLLGLAALAVLLTFVLFNRGGKHGSDESFRDGLVALWSGENDTLDRLGQHHGKGLNVSFARGVAGHAFHLNGSNACVEIPDSPDFKPTNITVEAWVKFDTLKSPHANLPGQQSIVFKASTRNPRLGNFTGYGLAKNPDQFVFTVGSAAGVQVEACSLTVPQVGVWYHLVGIFEDFSGDAQIYVNGIPEGCAHAGFHLSCGTRPLFIGMTGEVWEGKLEGSVDEIAIYNRALSPTEIQADYAAIRSEQEPAPNQSRLSRVPPGNTDSLPAKNTSPSEGLVAFWSAAGRGGDPVGKHTGTLTHVTVAENDKSPAFVFDATNAAIQIPASHDLDVGTFDGFTVTAWIKPQSTDLQTICEWNLNNGVHHGGEPIGVCMEIYECCGEGSLVANIVDTNGVSHAIRSIGEVITPNRFQQVAMTYDKLKGIAALYRDGIVVGRMNLTSFTPQTGFDLFIGNRPAGAFTGICFQGHMDEIAIYNRALTAAEMRERYEAAGRRIASR